MKLNKQGLVDSIQGCINCYLTKKGKPKRGKHDYSIYDTYERFSNKNSAGIIGYKKKSIMKIDIEGSGESKDWWQNLDMKKVEPLYKSNKKILVHKGFKEAYMNLRDIIIPKAEAHVKKGNKGFIIDGHSHGSSVGLIGYRDIIWHAAHKWKRKVDIACVQWAGARVYNNAGLYSFKKCEGHIYLIELNNDPVCNVPPEWTGFRHVFDTYIPLRAFPYIPIFEIPVLRLVSVWNHLPQRYKKATRKHKGKI